MLFWPYADLSVTFGGDAGYGLTLVVSVEQTFSLLFTSSDVRRRLLGPATFFYFVWLSCL